MPFQTKRKQAGDLIKSADWNEVGDEVVRLENDKVNRSGDTIHGTLQVDGNVGLGGAPTTDKLSVTGTVRATGFSGSGDGLSQLNAGNLSTGTVADARIPSTIARETGVAARFDPTNGHKHTGVAGDGARLAHGSLANILGVSLASTDALLDKHVSNAQATAWQNHLHTYDLKNSQFVTFGFATPSASGAEQPMNLAFAHAKLVWATGCCRATYTTGARYYANSWGWADMRGTGCNCMGTVSPMMQQEPFFQDSKIFAVKFLMSSGGAAVTTDVLTVAIYQPQDGKMTARLTTFLGATAPQSGAPALHVSQYSLSINLLIFGF